MDCRICATPLPKAPEVIAREMMFGRRDEHAYFMCSGCGCLQIAEVPADLGSYYEGGYYSYGMAPLSGWRGWLATQRDLSAATGRGLVGSLLGRLRPTHDLDFLRPLLGTIGSGSHILDVGCGSGALVQRLRRIGFKRTFGVDPYVTAAITAGDETVVHKRDPTTLTGPFDLVMFHHSFEHLIDPYPVLRWCRSQLATAGVCVLRVPLVSSLAWERYREHWVQLDAPRHLYLHSESSMRKLAAATGFDCQQVVYDSNAFQFWGSERYRMGIPLKEDRSLAVQSRAPLFSKARMAAWEQEAQVLNRASRGDQACFYFRPF
jgi:SAM-dependent methyltransferase